MRIISISTENYLPNAQRLFQSIRRFYPNAQLTLFSESNDPKNLLNGLDVNIILLPEIRSLGVKRAKFKAYSLASCDGGFVYLDSDIIVLQKLKELENVSYFTACKDDLSECPFIINKLYPWENYPTIQASNYFNSGVFACPVGMQNFFKTIEAESCNNSDWESVVIPGKLYDNHFLCFKIVQYGIGVNFISSFEYNWQGFQKGGQLCCYLRQDNVLINANSGSEVKLVHFAGIQDIESYIRQLPADLSSHLMKANL
jgi:hypothetical protein